MKYNLHIENNKTIYEKRPCPIYLHRCYTYSANTVIASICRISQTNELIFWLIYVES